MDHSQTRVTAARPMDYLEDEVASAFFRAREHEAYYRSLQLVEERRQFQAELRENLLTLLRLAGNDGLKTLEGIISRVSRDARAETAEAISESPTERVRRIEPTGVRLLELGAVLDLGRLRTAYRSAALRYHPDRGGSNEEMTSVNHAYEQLHRILIEEGSCETPWASDELAGTYDYLWSVRRLLLDVALDEWALDEAATWLEAITSDRERCQKSQGQYLVDLIVPACKLTERLCAAGSINRARTSLAVAQEGLRLARGLGLNFEWNVRQAEDAVSGSHKPRFVLNDVGQAENAFRLGAIDEKRYQAILTRLAGRQAQKNTARSQRLDRLKEASFLSSLPIDDGLGPSAGFRGLVPHPGYFEWRAVNLTPDQQAEYLKAFREADDLALVAKYAFVRLSGLLRSAIYCPERCEPLSLLAEARTIEGLEPRCSWAASGVCDVLGRILELSGGLRAEYVGQLTKLLQPEPQPVGFVLIFTAEGPAELTPAFFDAARQLANKYSRAHRIG